MTIIEPTVDYGFREFRNFSLRAIKSSVSTLGDKRIKEITSLERKAILGFLKERDTFACLLTGYGKSFKIFHLLVRIVMTES